MSKKTIIGSSVFLAGLLVVIGLFWIYSGNGLFEQPESTQRASLSKEAVNKSATFIIRPKFNAVNHFKNGLAPVKLGDQWGYIKPSGQWAIEPEYSGAKHFTNKRAPVRSNGQWGYIDRTGQWIVPPKYDRAMTFSEKRAAVKKDDKWAYIDPQGNQITDFQYSLAGSFSEGRAAVARDIKIGYINRDGELIISFQFEDANNFTGAGLAAVEKFDLWGYTNRDGKIVYDHQFQWASPFQEGIARVKRNGQWHYLHRSGKLSPKLPFQLVYDFSGGRARVFQEGKFSFIDTGLNQPIPAEYSQALSFREGYAPAQKNGLWGYLDETNNWEITPRFEAADKFYGKIAAVKVDGKWGFIPHPELRTTALRFDTMTYTVQQGLESVSEESLNVPLSKTMNSWIFDRDKTYVNIGEGIIGRNWNREALETVTRGIDDNYIWEVTRFPYQEPSIYQIDNARLLYLRSLKAARNNNWFNFREALDDGYSDYAIINHHYLNKEAIADGKALVPNEPESLIYLENEKGEKKLAGFMYLLRSLDESGPQVGGPLTTWHYHVYDRRRCFRKGFLIDLDTNVCQDGVWVNRSQEMLHVWFVKHPQGTFGTRMGFRPGRIPKRTDSFLPRNK